MQTAPDYRIGTSYLVALSSSLGSLCWGYCLGIFNSVRPYFQTYLFPDATENEIAFLASSLVIGAAIGAFACGKIVNSIGRRNTLLVCDFASILGSVFSMIQSLPLIALGRFISGIVLGVNSVAIPLYNVEMAPLQLKGIMSTISMIFVSLGTLFGLAMSFLVPNGEDATNNEMWRLIMGFPISFNIGRILLLVFIFKYETPIYLAIRGNITEARMALQLIYTDNIDQHMQKVMKDKEATTSAKGDLTLKDLITPRYRKAFFMGTVIGASRQLTGFGPIFMFFNTFTAESAGNDLDTLALFSTLLGVISLVFSLITTVIVERFGRRPLMVCGTCLMFIDEVLYILVRLFDGPANVSLKYLVILWPVFYRLSDGTLGFAYISELLPSAGASFTTFVNWFCSFLLVQTVLPLGSWIGANGLMTVYASFTLFSLVIYSKYMIESKGKTKAELLELYRTDMDHRKQGEDVEMKRMLLPQK